MLSVCLYVAKDTCMFLSTLWCQIFRALKVNKGRIMKNNKNITKTIIGGALLLSPLMSYAETTFVTEVLIGQSKHNIKSSINAELSNESYSASLDESSFGFRLGVKFWDYVSIEIAKHDHGSAVNEFTIYYPAPFSPTPGSSGCCLGPEHDITQEARLPIDIESLRLGIKTEYELFTNFSVNARLGLAHWSYDHYSPQQTILPSSSTNGGESGNDIYYSIGGNYQFTESIHVGLEYSLFTVSEGFDPRMGIDGSYEHDIEDISLVLGWRF